MTHSSNKYTRRLEVGGNIDSSLVPVSKTIVTFLVVSSVEKRGLLSITSGEYFARESVGQSEIHYLYHTSRNILSIDEIIKKVVEPKTSNLFDLFLPTGVVWREGVRVCVRVYSSR